MTDDGGRALENTRGYGAGGRMFFFRDRQVLVLDRMSAIFPRDPFLTKTIGLSVCCEGPTRIADSDYNRERLALFVPHEESAPRLPII